MEDLSNKTLDVSSLSNTDYTDQEFVAEMQSRTSAILRREFPNVWQKQQVNKDVNGLVIACPYCGDSSKDMNKKRGHLLFKGKWAGYYKCFNCGHFVRIPNFFQDFNETMSLSGIAYVQEHRQSLASFTTVSTEITADVFCKSFALTYGIERNYFRDMLGLVEIARTPQAMPAYEYLVGRMQYKFENFLYYPKKNYVIILNIAENKVIGFQMRALDKSVPKEKRFLTFNMERIYKKILKNNTIAIPNDLNTVSTLFNIYKVNVYKPILVTEGPMDAFLLPNAIATSGANKTLNVELPFWYVYDSDSTGMKHALSKLKEKQYVFLWGKMKNDLNLPKREKWDVNDVVLYCRDKYGEQFKIDWLKYFSNNPLDMIYLDDLSFGF